MTHKERKAEVREILAPYRLMAEKINYRQLSLKNLRIVSDYGTAQKPRFNI